MLMKEFVKLQVNFFFTDRKIRNCRLGGQLDKTNRELTYLKWDQKENF